VAETGLPILRQGLGRTQRRDAWWAEIIPVIIVLGGFGLYATFRAFEGAFYDPRLYGFASPYLSPFYSPLIDVNHHWWRWSPALLILGGPLGFRATCYYYRKAYYRSFFWSPPACSIPDARPRYSGETIFPFLIQNIHRYFFYLAVLLVVFLWWDALLAFRFPNGFGIGLGTLILVANVAMLSLYTFSCHSCRHLCGGYLDSFARAPLRYRLWRTFNRLNARHGMYAWISLFSVIIADVYVRLVAMGVLTDLRFV